MRKWILFALVGLVLLYVFRLREGVDDTLTKEPECPSGMSLQGELCRKDYGGPTVCPAGQPAENGFCMQSDGTGGTYGVGAICEEGSPVNGRCVNTRPPNCPSGYVFETGGFFGTYKCITTARAAKNRAYEAGQWSPAAEPVAPRTTGSTTSSYTPIPVAIGGALPSAINESASSGDTDTTRPMDGDVFASGGPFSGQSGTGRGSGAAAASNMTGNTYGPSGPTASLTAFDFYPKSGPSPAPPGTSLRVKGPSWGGRGQSAASASASSSIPNPFLYGPGSGNASSRSQTNSQDISMLPSLDSLGSNPENQYAPTSRVPGDQDLVPNPYLQSTSYSLANNSQKTDPVPFLANFSAFQK